MASSQNFTASAWAKIQGRIAQIFAGQTPADFTRYAPGNSFNALATSNQARADLIRDGRNNCRTVEVYHFPYTITTAATVSTSLSDLGCTITPADYGTTKATSYTPNLYVTKIVAVDDDLCGDFFANPSADGSERAIAHVTERLTQAMQEMRNALDQEIAKRLYALRQTANYAPTLMPGMEFDAGTQTWPLAYDYFKSPDTLTMLDSTMINNGIGQYFILGGQNGFYNAFTNAQWRQLNSEERFLTRFGTGRFAFDIFNLDKTVGEQFGDTSRSFTFLIPDGSYALINFRDYLTEIPQRIDKMDKPTWSMSMADPVLRINDNGVLRPVYYDIHYQTACTGTDANGTFTFSHAFQLVYKGLFAGAPVDTAGRTGIMLLQTTPGL